ncbi:ATPase [uncultured Capnocytophaga sp.]|uniref:ATPase n=1 Tax=uncultured Capnocytophaga sp. TaxID=159273 RepID=UPI00260B83AD|nr:ATPase [uncultured Capnocytophaga sp.]
MKHFLIPFLFISTAVFAQNTNNKVERYKTDPAINDEFKKPLLGKVKTMHTAHYFIEYNKYDTIKKELFDNNYTYGFDKEGREILFIKYDMHGNISSKYERRYNEKDSLTYLREFIWGENFGTYIGEKSYFYNPLGLLQEVKGCSLKESDIFFLNRELYKYNDKQQLLESHYYSNDTLIETVIRSYNDMGKLIKELDYSKGKLRSEYKLEYDERDNLIKKDYYFTQFSISQKSITKYQYDEQNRLILATENIDGDENILIKNIYKDNLPIESYEKNRSGDEIHIFYHYKENQLIEEEKSTRFFNGHYYSTTKEKIQYDEKCRIKKFYDYEGKEIARTYTHYYDDKDRIIKTELLYSNNKKKYWTNSYDMANNLTKTIYNNKEADKDIYRYDKNNNLLSKIIYKGNKEVYKVLYTYDKDNNLLSKTTYKGNKAIEKTFYTYDSYQNLIKIEKYNNGKNYIYERIFTYYE